MKAALFLSSFVVANSFVIQQIFTRERHSASPRTTQLSVLDTSTLPLAVEVFDGSTVDPVIVSGAFWTGLQTKFISVIIGQILATVVFGAVSTLAGSQFNRVSEWVSKEIFKEENINKAVNGVNEGINAAGNEVQKRVSSAPEPDLSKLAICIAIDLIGTSSELIPVLGELTDVAYAPIAGLVLRNLYGSNILFALEFTEEILPLTDILPLATICWVVDTFYGDTDIAKTLGLGNYNSRRIINDDDVIDVQSEIIQQKRLTDGDDKRR